MLINISLITYQGYYIFINSVIAFILARKNLRWQALKRSNIALLEGSPGAIMQIDYEGQIIFANNAASVLLNLPNINPKTEKRLSIQSMLASGSSLNTILSARPYSNQVVHFMINKLDGSQQEMWLLVALQYNQEEHLYMLSLTNIGEIYLQIKVQDEKIQETQLALRTLQMLHKNLEIEANNLDKQLQHTHLQLNAAIQIYTQAQQELNHYANVLLQAAGQYEVEVKKMLSSFTKHNLQSTYGPPTYDLNSPLSYIPPQPFHSNSYPEPYTSDLAYQISPFTKNDRSLHTYTVLLLESCALLLDYLKPTTSTIAVQIEVIHCLEKFNKNHLEIIYPSNDEKRIYIENDEPSWHRFCEVLFTWLSYYNAYLKLSYTTAHSALSSTGDDKPCLLLEMPNIGIKRLDEFNAKCMPSGLVPLVLQKLSSILGFKLILSADNAHLRILIPLK